VLQNSQERSTGKLIVERHYGSVWAIFQTYMASSLADKAKPSFFQGLDQIIAG
jgi:hypothetical protein